MLFAGYETNAGEIDLLVNIIFYQNGGDVLFNFNI